MNFWFIFPFLHLKQIFYILPQHLIIKHQINKKELTNQLLCVIIITESADDGCFRTYDYEITAKLVAWRLFLFIYVVDVIQQNENQADYHQHLFKLQLHPHHLPSREGKKKFHLPAKGSNRHRFGVLRVSEDTVNIIS